MKVVAVLVHHVVCAADPCPVHAGAHVAYCRNVIDVWPGLVVGISGMHPQLISMEGTNGPSPCAVCIAAGIVCKQAAATGQDVYSAAWYA